MKIQKKLSKKMRDSPFKLNKILQEKHLVIKCQETANYKC